MRRKCRSFYTSLNAKKELHKEFSSCRLLILWRMCDILYGDVRMAESADAADLKSASFGSTGSSPVPDTSFRCAIPVKSKLQLVKINFPRWSFFFLPLIFVLQKRDCSLLCGLPSLCSDSRLRLVKSHLQYHFFVISR